MIVISDMMGTLTQGSPVLGLVDWVKKFQSKTSAQMFMASIMPSYLLAKKGLINQQTWGQNLMVRSLNLIRSADPEKFSTIANWIVETDLWPKRREDVIARLENHAAQSDEVYIASSVMEPVVEIFARKINVKAIGSPIEFSNGKVKFSGNLVSNDQKIKQVLLRLGVTNVDVAYGDTEQDIPLLENARRPVAVYPNKILTAEAMKRGWEIFDTQTKPS